MNRWGRSRPRFQIIHGSSPAARDDHPVILEIRRHLMNRAPSFQVTIRAGDQLFVRGNSAEAAMSYLQSVYEIRRPFVHDDFDYLRQAVRKVECSVRWTAQMMDIHYTVQYLTTREQERMIGERLQELIDTSGVDRKSDFQKIKFVYNYILDHVEYDHTLANHSAYHALFEGKAVCEGCAALLYRFLSSVNVPCRIITGQGLRERHTWNIVKLNADWYNLDVTWDLYTGQRFLLWRNTRWFLKGERGFPSHIRDTLYNNEAFNDRYPIALRDYFI